MQRKTRPDRIALTRGMTLGAAARAVLRQGIDHMAANERAGCAAEADGIHQMRVAARRLRVALALFADICVAGEFARLDSELRWLARKLGQARDWDVLADSTAFAIGYAQPLLAAEIAAAAKPIRASRQQSIAATIRGARYRRLLRSLRALTRLRRHSPEQRARLALPLATAAATYLDRWWRDSRDAGRGMSRHGAAQRHRLRKAVRRFRYGIEFLAGCYPRVQVKPFAKRLAKLQDVLGAMNDLATGAELIAAIDTSALSHRQKADAKRFFRRQTRELRRKYQRAWRRYKAMPGFWA